MQMEILNDYCSSIEYYRSRNRQRERINASSGISFTGMSKPKEYANAIEYMAATIIDNSEDLVKALGAKPIGKAQIQNTVNVLYAKNLVFNSPPNLDLSKTKFPNEFNNCLRLSIKKDIDYARKTIMDVWKQILTVNQRIKYTTMTFHPYTGKLKSFLIYNGERDGENYFDKIKENPILKFVIWKSFMSDLSQANRHIPMPINPLVMRNTVEYFESMKKDEYVSCANGISKFREKYQQELINNAVNCIVENKENEYKKIKLYDIEGNLIPLDERKDINLQKTEGIWIEIPRINRDTKHSSRNISLLEQLSSTNWCTKSRSNMAAKYLIGGNFYIYLEHDMKKNIWTPEIGITSILEKNKGNVLQRIQGVKNDNIVPEKHKEKILKLIQKNKFICAEYPSDCEGRFAAEQLDIRNGSF